MKSFVANVEELLPIKAVYRECMAGNNRDLDTYEENRRWLQNYSRSNKRTLFKFDYKSEKSNLTLTTVQILNCLFLSNNNILDLNWFEKECKLVKNTKWDGIAFCLQDKRFTPVLVEFSGGFDFNTTSKKENDDENKLVDGIKEILKYNDASGSKQSLIMLNESSRRCNCCITLMHKWKIKNIFRYNCTEGFCGVFLSSNTNWWYSCSPAPTFFNDLIRRCSVAFHQFPKAFPLLHVWEDPETRKPWSIAFSRLWL